MTDDVNNPEHYNKQGIEVIDVIEAYELPYHLGNVIKYVCRHAYKGHEEQDLRKALWYLDRYIEETFDHLRGYSLSEAQAFFDVYDLADGPLDRGGYTVSEAEAFFEGYDLAKEDAREEAADIAIQRANVPLPDPLADVEVHCPPDRIAGDDAAATHTKDSYYGFDRTAIQGHCGYCDKELRLDATYATTHIHPDVKFCGLSCIAKLTAWESGW